MSSSAWSSERSGLDPRTTPLRVGVLADYDVAGARAESELVAELVGWDWPVVLLHPSAPASALRHSAARCEVLLFHGIRGNRRARRVLRGSRPTVTLVRPGPITALPSVLPEVGLRRPSGTLVVSHKRDARLLRAASAAPLVLLEQPTPRDLAAVLQRARPSDA